MKDSVIDTLTEKVRQEVNEKVPHRASKAEEEQQKKAVKDEIQGYKIDIKELTITSKRWHKKYMKKDKELQKAKNDNEKMKKELEGRQQEVNRQIKEVKRYRYMNGKVEEERDEFSEELTELKKELLIYKQAERQQKESGTHIETVKQEFDEYRKQAEITQSTLEEKLTKLQKQNKNLKKEVRGQQKGRSKVDRARKQAIEESQNKDKKIKNLLRIQGENKQREKDYEDQIRSLREQNTEEVTPKERIEDLTIHLTTESVSDYEGVVEFYKVYKRMVQQKKREESIEGKKNGYILKEGKAFFIALDGSKPRKITNPKKLKIRDGDVCRAILIRGGIAELDYIYKEYNNSLREFTVEEKLKLKETNKVRKGKKKNINSQFMEVIYEKNVLVISAKGLDSYKEYLGRYGNVVKFENPYDTGLQSLFREIDKADIVVVRADATSHSVTDYLKEHAKSKTGFVYDASPKEVTNTIYKQATQK